MFRIVVISGIKVMKYWLTVVTPWRPGEVKAMGVRNRLVRKETSVTVYLSTRQHITNEKNTGNESSS
jgi:hypothetical protein